MHLSSLRIAKCRGFTLLELMTTVAILGLVISLSAAALMGLRPKANLVSSAGEVVSSFQTAKLHARSRNVETWFGIQIPDDASLGVRFVLIEDPQSSFEPNFQAFGEATAPSRVVDLVQFPNSVIGTPETRFGSLNAIPESFRPVTGSIGANGCSFCDANGVGWIHVLPRGEIRAWNVAPPRGIEGLLLGTRDPVDHANLPIMVVFSVPFGLVERYDANP